MESENPVNELEEYASKVIKAENRYHQEVTIRKVRGTCPYGHREGDIFRVTAMNGDGICGSLLQGIFSPLPRCTMAETSSGRKMPAPIAAAVWKMALLRR